MGTEDNPTENQTAPMEEQHEDAGSAGIPRPAQQVIAPIESVFRPYEYRSGTTVKVVGVCCRSCRLNWKFNTGAPQHQVCPQCANICNLIDAEDTSIPGSAVSDVEPMIITRVAWGRLSRSL